MKQAIEYRLDRFDGYDESPGARPGGLVAYLNEIGKERWILIESNSVRGREQYLFYRVNEW